jgi:ATP-dependent exoDNAse (exonuclease V) beta subunit
MHTSSEIRDELHDMLHAFSTSSIYAELQQAEILGREVPFAIPSPRTANLEPGASILEGVLDIVYRCHGRVWIGDYKTDRVKAAEVEKRAGEYALQARLYREAVKRCLNLESGFKFIFLRTGQIVEFTEGGW